MISSRSGTTVIRAVLSFVIIAGYGAVLFLFLSQDRNLTEPMERVLNVLFGALTAMLLQVNSFWFGTTQSSAEKTAEITERRQS